MALKLKNAIEEVSMENCVRFFLLHYVYEYVCSISFRNSQHYRRIDSTCLVLHFVCTLCNVCGWMVVHV